MSEEDLKPCPFCGSSAKLKEHYMNLKESSPIYFCVSCDNLKEPECPRPTTPYNTKKKAIENWNRRSPK